MCGVYISYPFCAQKCTYCNFASGVMPRELEEPYCGALVREIVATTWVDTPDTVYLGGGTPSSIQPDQLDRILRAIPGRPWREATLEAAPGTLDASKIVRWQAAGINRISLGVQSFNTQELRRTARRHTAEIVQSDVKLLRDSGIMNINLDLIAGLPGQTIASWNESLDWISRLDPPHVSVYMLEVDEDSRLGKEMLLGGVHYGASDAPDEELTAELYEIAMHRLRSIGVERYEISNFAKPGFESLHNLKYWHRESYFGFGADAHSCVNGRRWQNTELLEDYIHGSPNARTSEAPADDAEEKFFVGLRLAEGIEPSAADLHRHADAISRFLKHELLERAGTRLRLTDRGVMVSNEVLQEFLTA